MVLDSRQDRFEMLSFYTVEQTQEIPVNQQTVDLFGTSEQAGQLLTYMELC